MLQQVKILLVEDDEDDYLLAKGYLSEASNISYELDWVSDYEEARSIISNHNHDLYLLDYRLGTKNGIDLLKEARSKGCNNPFILLTGQEEKTIDHEAMQAGAVDFVAKENLSQYLERSVRYALSRWNMEQRLCASEAQQRAILESIDEYVCVIKFENASSESKKVEFITPQVETVTGYSVREILEDVELLFSIVHKQDEAKLKGSIKQLFESNKPVSCEYRIMQKSGEYIWLENRIIPQLNNHEDIDSCIIVGRDISERKAHENQLIYAAFHDSLTGLPNRELFSNRMELAINRVKRNQNYKWALLYLDFDGFKQINDTYGHETGDQFLIKTSHMIHSCLRSIDTMARFGGDEFVILLEEISNLEDTDIVSSRIHNLFKNSIKLNELKLNVSVSIGIALANANYSSPEDVLRDADCAMYHAKQTGKAKHVIFDGNTMQADAIRRDRGY